jgi:predicted PhzF superfamily epimerase YddE/YHI9
MSLLTGSL